eukprot:g4505.t1
MDRQEEEFRAALEEEQRRSEIEIERVREDLLKLTFDSEVTFDFDSAGIKPSFEDSLDKVSEVIAKYESEAEVVGHTDSTGSETYNQQLSERRALAVKTYLLEHGAGLTQLSSSEGDVIKNQQGQTFEVIGVHENASLYIYQGQPLELPGADPAIIPEAELNDFTQISKPNQRLFAGQIDNSNFFELRRKTLELVDQWLVEMLRRFNLHFSIFDESRLAADEDEENLFEDQPHINHFEEEQLVLCSLDFLREHPDAFVQANEASWDLLVVDEAHHLEWTEEEASPDYQMVEMLAQAIPGVLLLTATPEQLGKAGHFARLRLLDPDRFPAYADYLEEEQSYRPIADAVELLSDGKAIGPGTPEWGLLEDALAGDTALSEETEDLMKELADAAVTDETKESHRDRLICHLLDRHGTGRVLSFVFCLRSGFFGFGSRFFFGSRLFFGSSLFSWSFFRGFFYDFFHGLRLGFSQLEQQLPGDLHRVVRDVVKEGLAEQQALIDAYQELAGRDDLDKHDMQQMVDLQSQIDAAGGWQLDQQVETIISQLELPGDARLEDLSGGWRRRVALGKALVSQPEVLMLDEPTNHLDISTIEWLEHRVRGYLGAVIFVTHDRSFLQKLATRIVEIDRGQLISWPGSYSKYLELKEKANQDEDNANALFDKRLAQEETWIRQGIKARRTRNEGRVRALEAMREERAKRVKRQGKAKIQISEAEGSGRKVVEARSLTHGYNGETLIRDFKIKIMRGDRIGLIGNNGVGKSTLLKILLGQLEPDQGSLKIGTNLVTGYFDQVRRELEWDKTVAENVGDGKEYIKINGRDRHIVGYLRNFLFSAKRAMTPVSRLSGGECNRVLLAKLFTQPNNLLVLDEPTNDLDVEMLEVLEQQLVDYQGTLIIVSHDRDFLDNVVTSTLVFEEGGKVVEYAGGYSDWARRGKALKIAEKAPRSNLEVPGSEGSGIGGQVAKPKKLSYKYQRELDMLPGKIESLEQKVTELQEVIADPDFYNQPFEKTQPVMDELSSFQRELDKTTARWIELEEMAS